MDVGSVNPLVIGGIILNLIISSGVLWKLIDFARGYGQLEQRVNFTEAEIKHLRFDQFREVSNEQR